MSFYGFLPVLLCDHFQVAAAAKIIPPALSPSFSEWPSSPSACGHGARRWVLLLSPSNKVEYIRSQPSKLANHAHVSPVVHIRQPKQWLCCITEECETFPNGNAPPFEQWTEESLMLCTDLDICALLNGSCRGRLHSMCTVKTLEPEWHRLFNMTLSSWHNSSSVIFTLES